MPNSWFIADFHLGHSNIIRYCTRPFATIEEMDQAILERKARRHAPDDSEEQKTPAAAVSTHCACLAFRLIGLSVALRR